MAVSHAVFHIDFSDTAHLTPTSHFDHLAGHGIGAGEVTPGQELAEVEAVVAVGGVHRPEATDHRRAKVRP